MSVPMKLFSWQTISRNRNLRTWPWRPSSGKILSSPLKETTGNGFEKCSIQPLHQVILKLWSRTSLKNQMSLLKNSIKSHNQGKLSEWMNWLRYYILGIGWYGDSIWRLISLPGWSLVFDWIRKRYRIIWSMHSLVSLSIPLNSPPRGSSSEQSTHSVTTNATATNSSSPSPHRNWS